MRICCITQGIQRGLCDKLKGGMRKEMGGKFRREGTWVYLWLIFVDACHKTTKLSKAIILQLKNLKKDVGCLIPTVLAQLQFFFKQKLQFSSLEA